MTDWKAKYEEERKMADEIARRLDDLAGRCWDNVRGGGVALRAPDWSTLNAAIESYDDYAERRAKEPPCQS